MLVLAIDAPALLSAPVELPTCRICAEVASDAGILVIITRRKSKCLVFDVSHGILFFFFAPPDPLFAPCTCRGALREYKISFFLSFFLPPIRCSPSSAVAAASPSHRSARSTLPWLNCLALVLSSSSSFSSPSRRRRAHRHHGAGACVVPADVDPVALSSLARCGASPRAGRIGW